MLKKRYISLFLVLMLVFMGWAAAETAEPTPQPTPEPQKLPISINGYELTYDDIMQESISFHLPDDAFALSENAVNFTIQVDETEYPLFTMYVYSDEGDTHTVIWTEAGDIIPVSFVYSPIPEDLPPEKHLLFQLDAEEAVNMLIATLQIHQIPSGQHSALDDEAVILLEDYQITFVMQKTVRLQMIAEGNQADFLLTLANGTQHPVFTLTCGSQEGSIVTVLKDDAGESVPVSFTMHPLSAELDEAARNQFYLGQELVNDVLSTIKVTAVP